MWDSFRRVNGWQSRESPIIFWSSLGQNSSRRERGKWEQLFSLFQNLSLIVRTELNREQKYHSEILLIFKGAEVSQEGEEKKDYGCPALMQRAKRSQKSPNKVDSIPDLIFTHCTAFINASFQASWPCWGIHSFPGQWRFRLSSAGSPSWFPSSPAWGGVSFSPNPQTALGVNYSAPPQLSPYHETCGGRTWG